MSWDSLFLVACLIVFFHKYRNPDLNSVFIKASWDQALNYSANFVWYNVMQCEGCELWLVGRKIQYGCRRIKHQRNLHTWKLLFNNILNTNEIQQLGCYTHYIVKCIYMRRSSVSQWCPVRFHLKTSLIPSVWRLKATQIDAACWALARTWLTENTGIMQARLVL